MKLNSIYLIGSLKNREIGNLGVRLRQKLGIEIFNEWWSVGPDADDMWQAHERLMGKTYREALYGYHSLDVFKFDKEHLDRTDGVILAMPAGKSAHVELGYVIGKGKPAWILFDEEPPRYDIMMAFCNDVFFNEDELCEEVRKYMQ